MELVQMLFNNYSSNKEITFLFFTYDTAFYLSGKILLTGRDSLMVGCI